MLREEAIEAGRLFHRYLERPRRRRLARVVEAYYRFVWDTSLRVTGNFADAADITQDVFLKLLLHPPRPDQVKSPSGYLAWEVVGRATNLRRAAERQKARERTAASQAGADGLPAADLDELRARVRELPDELRIAVELRYFAGLRNSDIAALTGVGERHVEKRLEQARDLLRSRMGPLAPLILLLERAAADGNSIAPTREPPGELRAELFKIASSGAVLAVPLAKAVATAGGLTLAKKGTTAALAAAVLLLAGAATAVFLSAHGGSEDRWHSEGLENAWKTEPVAAAVPSTKDAAPKAVALESAARYGSVRGTIWDEEGRPMADVRVTLSALITEEEAAGLRAEGFPEAEAGPIGLEAVTGDSGEYSFEKLHPTKVTINAGKSPFLPNWVPRAKIKAGEVFQTCDLILCLPLRLHGTVRTPEGDAVKGAQVFINFDYAKHYFADPVEPELAPDHAFPVDDEGRFDTGFGIVNIRHFCSLPGYVVAPGREMRDFSISCRDFKEQEAHLDLVLRPERRLTVLVEEASGAPVAGARVSASRLEIHKALTDAKGRASLDRLPADDFGIFVSKDGYEDESVDTRAIDSSQVHVVLRKPCPGIEGQIVFDDALPEANREVSDIYFYELDGEQKPVRAIHEVAFDDKKNTFSSHPKGPLRFEALVKIGWRTLSRKPLVYDGRNKLEVDFQVRLEPPYISGRVLRASTREPLSGAPVTLHLPWRDEEISASWENYTFLNEVPFPRLPGNRSITRSGSDGSFLFLLSATDRYRPGSPLATRPILTAGSEDLGYSADLVFDLDIQAGTAVKGIELEIAAPGAIEGSVVDEAGQPLPGALVAAYDGYNIVKHSKSDAAAAYRIDGLRPGRYMVEFLGHAPYATQGGGGGGMDAEGLPGPSAFFERPVQVEAGKTSRWGLDLRTDALGAIDGMVPVELKGAARAVCGLLAGGRPRGGSAFEREDELRDGRFQLERLFPGTYRVWLRASDGGRLSEADVVVRRGPRTSLTMPPPTGALVIPLQGTSGQQISGAKVVRLVRREAYRIGGAPVVTEIAAGRVTVTGESVRLDGLVTGSVQATILLPGFEALESEPVWVAEGRESVAPPLALVPGSTVRVRLELEDGLKLPEAPAFTVIDPRSGAQVPVNAARQGEALVWVLSGLPAGAFTIQVDAGSGLLDASVDVTTRRESEVETTVRIERRRN
jgi:RNA polymerase sigma-70 factor (ECF subfamily)